MNADLFADQDLVIPSGWCHPGAVAALLDAQHYLGPSPRGEAWSDEFGAIVLGPPTSRNIPGHWFELIRWCLLPGVKNAGSRQWAAMIRALRARHPEVTTIVSYSDPSVGHTGALYRACNWLWAPTWHRLRPPPTGNGAWIAGEAQSVKDRWVFCVRPDPQRAAILQIDDGGVLARFPWAVYQEPGGVPYAPWRAHNAASRRSVGNLQKGPERHEANEAKNEAEAEAPNEEGLRR